MKKIEKFWERFKHTLESCWLCLRFPFLYPRNRFTGRHTANVLNNLLWNLKEQSTQDITITSKLVDKSANNYFYFSYMYFLKYKVKLNKEDKTLIISRYRDVKTHDIKSLLWKDERFEILGLDLDFSLTGTPIVKIVVKVKNESDKTNYGFHYEHEEIVTNKCKYFWYKVLKWIDSEILDRILFIPTWNELDAMPKGWRKAFGLQMCEEIKQALLKHGRKYLRNYRIMQIKEKFARLCWYDENSVQEVYDIIEKYERMSYITCIDCGKPATKYSTGWICPYCNDCYKES